MKISFMFLILFLAMACGKEKKKPEIIYIDRPVPTEKLTPTCEKLYTDCYYDLKIKSQFLKESLSELHIVLKKRETKAYKSFELFSTFKIDHCTILENNKLINIVTKEVIQQSYQIIEEARKILGERS